MNAGIVLPNANGRSDVRDLARQAEELGLKSVWVPDGFSGDHLELFTTMSAVASSTDRIEVGAYMLNASLRDPALMAKMAATLDRLAPGRIRILLGTGWDRSDYEALGTEFPSPDVRTEHTRRALAALKRETQVSVEVAGVRDDVLKLAASEADGWSLSADALDTYFERVAFLREICADAGRAFGELRISCTVPCIEDVAERLADLGAHGMHEFRIVLDGHDRSHLERLAEETRPIAGTQPKEGQRV